MDEKALVRWHEQCAAAPGKKWRVLAHDGATPIEYTDQGVFDEFVVDHWLHLEQMDKRRWWMRLGDARLWILVEADGSVVVDIEHGAHDAIRGTTKVNSDG